MNGKTILKRGKEKPLRQHHPWIFSGAILRTEGVRTENANDGDTVDVYDAAGEWLARAAYNSRSQIAARVWTFERGERVDESFFQKRIRQALEFRKSLQTSEISGNFGSLNAFRVVNAESDFLPGIIVDRYADLLVVQFLTLGAELHKQEIVEALKELFVENQSLVLNLPSPVPRSPPPVTCIYERSDVDVRKKEGLKEATGVLFGKEPPDKIEIAENGLRLLVDVRRGHKTGFYLDQRVNRERALPYLRGEVLNAFAYTGAFGVYAAKLNGASVTNLDASASSLELARENFALDGVATNADFVVADAFEKLREFRAAGKKFDAIVLDPPKFVTSAANLERATRGYKDLNMLAFQLLKPNGFLVTFSCSGLVDAKLFQQIVFSAAVDGKRDAQIVEKLGQSPDHPIGLNFPEGEYLKGLIVRVV
ncbi:MAG: methyltransferase domain-containing protein [Chloroflexota bacterium]|nr:MAG: methyltransferase domain-containing protein [Chloroflexota bacterium]